MPWSILTVELIICGWILVMLTGDLVLPATRRSNLWVLAFGGILLAAGALACLSPPVLGQTFQTMFILDPFAVYFKGLFLLTAAIVVLMTREFFRHLTHNLGAFYILLFTSLLGMLVLASVNDLLMLFIGLELVTFSLYVMVAYLRTDRRAIEAGMKYLILGSVSSGFLIYGVALLYGFVGSTSFVMLRAAVEGGMMPFSAQVGLFFIMAGLGFKIAAVPFNFWVPDVYEGAPTPVVALISVGSKMAGVVALLRLFYGVFLPVDYVWAGLLAILAAVTMCYGNLAALPQTNIKRLLGYSAIGHAGYLLMGLSTATGEGATATGFYLLAYLFSTLIAFFVVVSATDAVGGDRLDDYNGLSRRSPLLAMGLFVAFLSLAGMPPLAGFVGKLLILVATAQSGQLWLVAIGAVNVVIALYYYLMVVRRMYFEPPKTAAPIVLNPVTTAALVFLLLGIVVIGIWPAPFLATVASSLPF